MVALADHYRAILTNRSRREMKNGSRISAAVLVLLYEKDAEPHTLLTKRTNHVSDHKGQISFPGGAQEADDGSIIDTALREALEEVGIRPEGVEVLGLLDDCETSTSNYVITPVVGFLSCSPEVRINPGEVEQVLEVPLAFFRNPRNKHSVFSENDSGAANHHYLYGEFCIWGATARILEQFVSLESTEQ